MSSKREHARKSRTLFRDGEPLTEQQVEDFVLLDLCDRRQAAGKSIDIPRDAGSRIAQLLQNEDTGWLYFLMQQEIAKVKIGFTRDPNRCIKVLEAYSALPVTVIAMVRAPADYEQALHRALELFHSHGEWFDVALPVAWLLTDVKYRRFRAVHEVIHRQGLYKPRPVG